MPADHTVIDIEEHTATPEEDQESLREVLEAVRGGTMDIASLRVELA